MEESEFLEEEIEDVLKEGDEIDFVWIEDRVPIPIEVKSKFHDSRPPKSLIKFMKN